MTDRPAWVVATWDQLGAGLRDLADPPNLNELRLIARNLELRGSVDKAARLRRVVITLQEMSFDLMLYSDDDDEAP